MEKDKIARFIIVIICIILILIFAKLIKDEEDNEQDIYIYDTEDVNIYQDVQVLEKELFEKYYIKAEEILNEMSLSEKVGQMFLVRYKDSGVIEEIKEYLPGGYVLFARDFKDKTKESIVEELKKCQEASKIPLFLGVDEEGGSVVRVSKFTQFRESPFLSIQELDQKGGIDLVIKDSTEKSELLKSLGLNINLAPVVDIPKDTSSFIYKRSMGKNAFETSEYTSKIIKNMNKDNMISVMKHFPGYGDNVDTHTGIAVDEREFSIFENEDFLPFISGIKENAPMIMVNHNIIQAIDDKNPASLSDAVHKILREKLNFSGIIITDDINMGALDNYIEDKNAATKAVMCGNDIIITSDFKNHKQEVIKAVENKIISEDIINTAVKRILACKLYYGIIK